MERLKRTPKRRSFRIFGKELDRTVFYFAVQLIAFWLMVLGMLIFVWIWYKAQ